ncbi:ribosome maturation factor RimP, partial [Clostridium saudiense]|nr:ribosome maturation factor RimP [Clostridium saudiense]
VNDDNIVVELEDEKLQIIPKEKIKSTNLEGEI